MKAARLLYQLAQRETYCFSFHCFSISWYHFSFNLSQYFFLVSRGAFDIQRRVAYLSQAAVCVQSAGSEDHDADLHDLVLEIRDKLDVAQIQLATRSVRF